MTSLEKETPATNLAECPRPTARRPVQTQSTPRIQFTVSTLTILGKAIQS